jgi:hypothetical protein
MRDTTQDLQIALSITEVNQILTALSDQPYGRVFQLIEKIQLQASALIDTDEPPPE